MKKLMVVILVLAVLGGTVFTAWAGMHFVGGVNTFGGSIHAEGDIAGISNAGGYVTLTGYAQLTGMCQNNGGNISPGRSPINGSASTTHTIQLDENGKTFVGLVVTDSAVAANTFQAVSPHPKSAGCPSDNWTVVDVVLNTWTGAKVEVFNADGSLAEAHHFQCSGVGTATTCWQ